jgi:hypothetical protein
MNLHVNGLSPIKCPSLQRKRAPYNLSTMFQMSHILGQGTWWISWATHLFSNLLTVISFQNHWWPFHVQSIVGRDSRRKSRKRAAKPLEQLLNLPFSKHFWMWTQTNVTWSERVRASGLYPVSNRNFTSSRIECSASSNFFSKSIDCVQISTTW